MSTIFTSSKQTKAKILALVALSSTISTTYPNKSALANTVANPTEQEQIIRKYGAKVSDTTQTENGGYIATRRSVRRVVIRPNGSRTISSSAKKTTSSTKKTSSKKQTTTASANTTQANQSAQTNVVSTVKPVKKVEKPKYSNEVWNTIDKNMSNSSEQESILKQQSILIKTEIERLKSEITNSKILILNEQIEIRNLRARSTQTQQDITDIANKENKIESEKSNIDKAYTQLQDIESKLNSRVNNLSNVTIRKAFEYMLQDIRTFGTSSKSYNYNLRPTNVTTVSQQQSTSTPYVDPTSAIARNESVPEGWEYLPSEPYFPNSYNDNSSNYDYDSYNYEPHYVPIFIPYPVHRPEPPRHHESHRPRPPRERER